MGKQFVIIGAGMAGLLAGAMLRNECDSIIEAQEELPNNHSAVLRFRSPIVGDTLNIPFRKVQVLKAISPWGKNPVADMLSYSKKTNGTYSLRSSISARGEVEERWVAPPDLVQRMADRVMGSIAFGVEAKSILSDCAQPIISTIPMPLLMGILEYPSKPEFGFIEGTNITATVPNCDAYVTVYVPDPSEPFSRISLTGDQLAIEFYPTTYGIAGRSIEWLKSQEVRMTDRALELLGIASPALNIEVHRQHYAKIRPIDEQARKRFMLWATETFQIYSLGRFATWRPGLLLDDLVQDVRVIQKIAREGSYDHRK